jgi:hypothetical protein
MADSTTETPLHEQARIAIDIVTTALQDAVRQELDMLRGSVQNHLAALDRVLSPEHTKPTFEPIIDKLCSTIAQQTSTMRATYERRVARAEADAAAAASARATADQLAAAAQTKADAARNEANAARTEANAARKNADTATAAMEKARKRIEALEQAQTDLVLQRDIANAHLEGEVHNRTALAAELESAKAQVKLAKADLHALRLELQRRAPAPEPAPAPSRVPAPAGFDANALLDQIRSTLRTLTKASNSQHLLAATLEVLADHFSRVALFASGPQGLKLWRSRGFDRLEGRKKTIVLPGDSAVSRAVASGDRVIVHAAPGESVPGVTGSQAAFAIALPVPANDGLTLVLYGENPPESSTRNAGELETIAGIVADHLAYRLRRKTGAPDTASPPQQAPLRRARRVRVPDGTPVDIDGAEGVLVDLSLVGAQVVSARAMKPNRAVRLMLPNGDGGVECEARVVWALVEPTPDQRKSQYRAGVQFTDSDAAQLEAFLAQQGTFRTDIKH